MDTGQSDTRQADTGQSDIGQTDNRQADTGQSDIGQVDTGQTDTGQNATGLAQESAFPAHFDWREHGKAPTVKDQGKIGACWAVAASSALEGALLPQERMVFSADHMTRKNAFGKDPESGGDYNMAMAYLTAWQGPVEETADPYGDGVSPEGLSAVRHVQEIRLLKKKDIDAMKELLYRYGPILSSLYMDMDEERHSSVYYNEFEDAYCYAGEAAVNHDLLIIGWDDDYPKENFSVNVQKNGAFLCQNSWGEQFGQEGAFYVSYEDQYLGNSCCCYSGVQAAENYDRIYQTDLCGWIGQIGYENTDECWVANVYVAEQRERLAAVGFYAVEPGISYEVYARENVGDAMQSPTGKPLASGTFTEAGFYTVGLEDSVELDAGERFAVCVRLRSEKGSSIAAIEYQAPENGNAENVTVADGEGYISADGTSWERTEEGGTPFNVCLKAYTQVCD